MQMGDATRENILSTVVHAKIRLGLFSDADVDIKLMSKLGFRSVLFLKGHSLRRQEKYPDAIKFLEEAVKEGKNSRASVHELAISYNKSSRVDKLRALLKSHGSLVKDSSMFADFQIGIDLARGDLAAVEAGIINLRRMPEDEGRSDIRQAQLLMRRGAYRPAKELLTKLLTEANRGRFILHSLRALAASRDHDFGLARQDIDFIKRTPGRQTAVTRLEATLHAEQGNYEPAQKLLSQIRDKGPEDWLLQARIYELQAASPSTSISERKELLEKATELRVKNGFAFEFDVDD
jgi:tetratricopeptide (TPR) repeat protein